MKWIYPKLTSYDRRSELVKITHIVQRTDMTSTKYHAEIRIGTVEIGKSNITGVK